MRKITWLALFSLLSAPLCCAFTARGPISATPGVSARCNRTEACLPFSSQEQFSLVWLCCEDANGWVSAHFLLPFGTYLFTHSITLTALQVLFSEYLEATALLLFGNVVFTVDDSTKLETWTGSLTGDGTIGFLAIVVGALFVRALRSPPLLPKRVRGWRWWKWLLLWGAYGAIFLLHLWQTGPDSSLNPGAIAAIGAQLVFLLAFFPWLSYRSRTDRSDVWHSELNDPYLKIYSKRQVWHIAIAWAMIVVACQLQTVGLQYLPNDWYQVLVSVAVVSLVLFSVGYVRHERWKRRHQR